MAKNQKTKNQTKKSAAVTDEVKEAIDLPTKADKPKKEKKAKPAKPQLPVHSDEMTLDDIEAFLTEHGHLGPEIERPDDIQAYLIECLDDKTFKQGKRTKPKKKEKPVIDYAWTDTDYKGRQVYTSRGTAIIQRASGDGVFFEVSNANGTFPVKSATTRFKAVNDAHRDKYVKDETIRTESGSPSIHCGDDISTALLGTTRAELSGVAKENKLQDKFEEWSVTKGLNAGMVRMNLGNVLRGRFKRGEAVVIFGEGDMGIARQRGEQRAAKEAEALKARKAAQKTGRDAKAQAAKDAKKAEKEAKAKKAEEKKAEAESKKAEKAAKKEAAKPKVATKDKKAA